MIENKKRLCYENDGRDGIDLRMVIDESVAFGWEVVQVQPHPQYKNGNVVECSRNTEMNNYTKIKELEDEYNSKLKILNKGKMQKIKGKIVSKNIFSGVGTALLSVFGIIFLLIGFAVPTLLGFAAFLLVPAVLLILLKNKKKAAVREQYEELNSLMEESKKLL